jgi:hypothetical protein
LQIGHKEGEDGWYQQVGRYWLEGTLTHNVDGRNHDHPWSAAFISWVMKSAGAGDRFRYSTQHSVYIFQAIRDRLAGRDAAGYWGCCLNEVWPVVGDLVCWSRQPGIDYDHQNGGQLCRPQRLSDGGGQWPDHRDRRQRRRLRDGATAGSGCFTDTFCQRRGVKRLSLPYAKPHSVDSGPALSQRLPLSSDATTCRAALRGSCEQLSQPD